MSEKVQFAATVSSKTEPDLWAQWRKKYNNTLTDFSAGEARVEESVLYRETHKLIVPIAGGAREQFVSLEFSSKVGLNAPHTADGVLQGQSLARELAMHTQFEWIDVARKELLDFARDRLKKGS